VRWVRFLVAHFERFLQKKKKDWAGNVGLKTTMWEKRSFRFLDLWKY
jgi:hypothetical protein